LVDSQDIEELVSIYQKKRSDLVLKKDEIEASINEIDVDISNLRSIIIPDKKQTGVPLRCVSLLACPVCQKSMALKNVEMNDRYIWSGDIECDCGYHACINEGILLTPNGNTSQYDYPDLKRALYKDLPPSLITLFQKTYNWNTAKLRDINLKNRVVLETNVNAYFFLQDHIKLLDKDGIYIIIDKFPETLKMYKEMIDKYELDIDILYIADSSTAFPLKKGIIDLFIDYFGSNEHCFYSQSWLIPDILDYFSADAQILGTFFYFTGNKSIRKLCEEYPEAYRNNFNLLDFTRSVKNSGFALVAQEDIGYTENSGNNFAFSFHVDGEKMYFRSFLAKKM
jgi:hypothetical protein